MTSTAADRVPRIIYNTDGGLVFNYLPDRKPEEITKLLPMLAEAGVDGFAVLVGIDDDLAWRGSRHAQMWGDNITCWDPDAPGTTPRTNPPQREQGEFRKMTGHQLLHANLVAVIEDGHDLMQLYVDRAHQHEMTILAGFRMNDAHTRDEDRAWMGRSELKHTRQDLLLGSPGTDDFHTNPWGFSWQWNYAMQEVRDRFLGLFDEVLTRNGFDGLELDFCRGPGFFRPGEVMKNVNTMTEFIRQAREIVRGHNKDGREPRLIVRVPPSIDESLELGIDTVTWAAEGLADGIVLGSVSLCTNEVDVARAVEAAGRDGPRIYTGLEGAVRLTSPLEGCDLNQPSVLRAIALNGYTQGAGGVYVFNYDCHRACRAWRRGEPIDEKELAADLQLLRELGDPETMKGLNRSYVVSDSHICKNPGYAPGDPRPQVPRKLPMIERGAGEYHALTLTIEDDVAAGLADGRIKSTELRVRLVDHEQCVDRIVCEVNGTRVELDPSRTIKNQWDDTWVIADGVPIRKGENRIFLAVRGAAAPSPWPMVEQCEVVVICRP